MQLVANRFNEASKQPWPITLDHADDLGSMFGPQHVNRTSSVEVDTAGLDDNNNQVHES